MIAVQNTSEWTRLCRALDLDVIVDDPRFATNEGRVAAADALDEAITARTSTMTADELVGRLESEGLAWARLNDLFAVLRHPQLTARDRWADVATPNGSFRALRPPVDISGVDMPMQPVPALGEHTDAILEWLGIAPDDADRSAYP